MKRSPRSEKSGSVQLSECPCCRGDATEEMKRRRARFVRLILMLKRFAEVVVDVDVDVDVDEGRMRLDESKMD